MISRVFVVLLVMGIMLSACAPKVQTPVPVKGLDDTPDPTSVRLVYHTRTPAPLSQPTSSPAPTATPNKDPDFFDGGLAITLDDVGQTVQVHVGQGFLLSLGNEYTWRVEITPPEIVTLNVKIPPEPGEQGVYIGREKGKATIKAVGEPACRNEQPACTRPSVLFQMTILVQ